MSGWVLSPEARGALGDIWDYLAARSPAAAEKTIGRFFEAFERLAERPGIGHFREDLTGGKALRVWPVYDYLILYDPTTRPLEIGRIVHGARDVASLLREGEEDD